MHDRFDITTLKIGAGRVRVATTPRAAGAVPLLVFNGLGIRLELTQAFAASLAARGIPVVTLDTPGIGGSSESLVPYRLPQAARLAAKVLDALGIARADVFGVSWGGTLAQEFARLYPRRTRRLVLCATFPGMFGAIGNFASLGRIARPKRVAASASRAQLAKAAGEVFGGAFRTDPTLIETYGDYLRPKKGLGFYQQMSALIGWSSVPWLRELKMPALVLFGSDDPIAPVANRRIFERLMPNARIVVIPDGHMFFVTRREELAGIVASFLTEASSSPAGEGPRAASTTLSPTG